MRMDAIRDIPDSALEAFRLAIDRAGGQLKFAKILGMTQGAVCKRLQRGKSLSAEEALIVARATGVPKEALCPQVFAIEETRSPPIHGAGAPDGAIAPDPSGVDPVESLRA